MKYIDKCSLNDKEVKRRKTKEMMALTATNYMNNKLLIENKYASMMSLIDAIYPPLLCTLCNTAFTSTADSNDHYIEKHKKRKRYICIHPHCDQRFLSRAALRFHISQSHLVINVKRPLHDPPLIQYNPPKPKQLPPVKQHPKDTVTNNNTHKASSPISQKKTPPVEDLTPPPSPFSLYQHKKSSKKPTLSAKAEQFLNSIYPPLQCPSCNQTFNRKTNVIKHLTESHLGQEPYRCIYPDCSHPRLYATREGLVYHIVRVHDDK
jgi:hypothetical protein